MSDVEKEDDYYEEEDDEVRECSNSCSHFDEINQCCWLASERGLCTDVSEGDICIYGLRRKQF